VQLRRGKLMRTRMRPATNWFQQLRLHQLNCVIVIEKLSTAIETPSPTQAVRRPGCVIMPAPVIHPLIYRSFARIPPKQRTPGYWVAAGWS